jgi:hypothetical protein
MTRLQTELQRLFLLPDAGPSAAGDIALVGLAGEVRAMVLEVARPAGWDALSKAWTGVQADLELPAPAIAVNGVDGCQLWFSLAQPVPLAEASAFLDALRSRYLDGVRPDRVAARPSASPDGKVVKAVPALQQATGNWSAFVAQDLAPLFAEEPWLDLTPGEDAQADLLSRIERIKPDVFARALQQLRQAPAATAQPVQAGVAVHALAQTTSIQGLDPKQFLLDVMADPTIDLRLRIEAAKALLPCNDPLRPLGR